MSDFCLLGKAISKNFAWFVKLWKSSCYNLSKINFPEENENTVELAN